MVTAQQQLNPIKSTLWLKLDEQHISSGINKTHNYGRSDGTPHEIQVGDGITTATFPLCATPKGFEFSDGYYLSPNIDLGTEWSISFHVNYNGANNEYIVGFSTGGGILLNDNAATNYLTYYDGTSRVSAGAALGRDRPYHVCVTKSAANSVKIYIDGILKATAPGTVGNTVLTRIGCSKDNTFYSHAVLLNFEAFKYELNSTQVVSLKNRLSRENITGGTSLFNPVMIPGCILYGGSYVEARATRGEQPTLYTAAADYTPSNAAIVLADDADVPAGLSGTSIKATCSDTATRYFSRAVNIVTGNRYDAAVWIKSDGTADIKVQDGTVLSLFAGPAVPAAWALYTGSDTAQDGSLLVARRNAAAAGTYYFRPVSLVNRSLQSYTPQFTTIPGSVLAQATPTAQPWVSSDGLGIRYQDDFLAWNAPKSATNCLHDGTGSTTIIAVRASVLNAANTIFSTADISNLRTGIGMWFTNANSVSIRGMDSSGVYTLTADIATAVAINTTYVFTLRTLAGANGISLRKNGASVYTGAFSAVSAADHTDTFRIGAQSSSAYPTDGIIGHPFVANRVLSDTECTAVENYILAQATL